MVDQCSNYKWNERELSKLEKIIKLDYRYSICSHKLDDKQLDLTNTRLKEVAASSILLLSCIHVAIIRLKVLDCWDPSIAMVRYVTS